MSAILTDERARRRSPPAANAPGPVPPTGRDGRRDRRTAVLFLDPRPLTRECVSRWLQANARDLVFLPVADAREARGVADAGGARLLVLNAAATRIQPEEVLDTVDLLRRLAPDLGIIVLSDREDYRHIVAAFRRGVRGYIPTSLPLPEAIEALRFVRAGGTFVPASILREPLREHGDGAAAGADSVPPEPAGADAVRLAGFTGRESEILARLSEGKSNKIIAYELDICDNTVKVHVKHIMRKLKTTNRTQAALLARSLFENGEIG